MEELGSDFSTGGHTNLCAGVVREREGRREKEKKRGGERKRSPTGGNSCLVPLKHFRQTFSEEPLDLFSLWMADQSDEGTRVVHELLYTAFSGI